MGVGAEGTSSGRGNLGLELSGRAGRTFQVEKS